MPHYKCVACKVRLHSAGRPADLVGDLCPGCGSLLEPVGELAEVVGFRSITSRDGDAPGTHQRLADTVGDFVALREAIRAQARRDADRWLDDGGSFSPEAVAEAMALPTPRETQRR
jgi:hypothetical protein